MQNWAITGATGFVGQHLVKKILTFPKVKLTIFDFKKHFLLKPNSLKDFVEGQDIIFHLAGKMKNNEEDFKTNTLGTYGLLEAIKRYGKDGVKLIFSSSFGVYQAHPEENLIEEDFTLEPRNIYGWSKLFAEQLIKHYVGLGKMKAIILRFSSVYGPKCPPSKQSLVSTWASLIGEGKLIEIWGDGRQKKDLVYIDDVVEALLKAVDAELPDCCGIFNICAGEGVSTNKIISILGEKLGKEPWTNYLKEKTTEANQYWVGDNQKAKRILAWQPKVEIERGLKTFAL